MSASDYRLSFTTGGLFLVESLTVSDLYIAMGDWKLVRETISTGNLLQARAMSSATRILQEVVLRLSELSDDEIKMLRNLTRSDQCYLLWMAVCRRYRFVGEFAEAVLRERFLSHRGTLDYEDFDAFFTKSCEWHPELEAITDSTRNKLRSVLFKIMREVGLVTERYEIVPSILGPELASSLIDRGAGDFKWFPTLQSAEAD